MGMSACLIFASNKSVRVTPWVAMGGVDFPSQCILDTHDGRKN